MYVSITGEHLQLIVTVTDSASAAAGVQEACGAYQFQILGDLSLILTLTYDDPSLYIYVTGQGPVGGPYPVTVEFSIPNDASVTPITTTFDIYMVESFNVLLQQESEMISVWTKSGYYFSTWANDGAVLENTAEETGSVSSDTGVAGNWRG